MTNVAKLTKAELIALVEEQNAKKAAFSAKMKAVMNDEAVKAKVTEKVKEYWSENEHPMKGKTFSDEAKANMKLGQAFIKAKRNGDVEGMNAALAALEANGVDITQDRYQI